MTDTHTDASRIAQFLRSEPGRRFFGDGPPEWNQLRGEKPPKTGAETRPERRRLVNALRRDGSPKALALAETLEECRVDARRCLSGACPVCGRAFQRMFAHATRNIYEHHQGDMMAIKIDSAKRAIRYRRLHRHNVFEGFERHLRDALDAVGLPALGGFHVLGKEYEAGTFESHWLPRAWILAPGRTALRVRAALGRWFPDTDIVLGAVRMKNFDGATVGFAYALKPDFERSIALDSPSKRLKNAKPPRSTRRKPIWGAQRVELALALDRAGLATRLFLKGYRLVIADGDVEIVPVATRLKGSTPDGKKRRRRAPK